MAQLNLGQVVPNIEITETSEGKNVKFTTLTQEVDTLIKDGKDAVSPGGPGRQHRGADGHAGVPPQDAAPLLPPGHPRHSGAAGHPPCGAVCVFPFRKIMM